MDDLAFSKTLEFPNDFVDEIWVKLLPEIRYLRRCIKPTSKRMFFCLDISSFYKNWTGPKTVKIDIELTNRLIEADNSKAGGTYCWKNPQLEIKEFTIKINKIIKFVDKYIKRNELENLEKKDYYTTINKIVNEGIDNYPEITFKLIEEIITKKYSIKLNIKNIVHKI